jgi:Probable cobalt transporter subunit (CbtB)
VYRERREGTMLQTLTVVRPQPWVLIGLVVLSLFAWYTLALDQGWLLSWVQGAQAFDANFIHELVHDTRHAAGFPCH